MSSAIGRPDVESAVAAGAKPDSSDESTESEDKSSVEEVSTEAEAANAENEEVTEDSTKESADNDEPETVEVDESEGSPKITVDDIKTAPMDYRFPTTNQAKHCFTRYMEYHRCVKEKGEGDPECEKYSRYYRSLCPGEWIERWNEQRENGTFPGRI